jgi:hypothetical protein
MAVMGANPHPLDLHELALLLGADPAPPRVVQSEQPHHQIGQVDSFWVARLDPPSHFQLAAELRLIGRHAYWYVQQGSDVSPAVLQTAADTFDNVIYPEVRRLVGSEQFPGIDNDPRVTIFNGEVPGVAGYVSSNDSYPSSVRPFSNQRDIVYLNTQADPLGSAEYLATLTHEFTHLVHWNMGRMEDTWVKEGLGFLVPSLVLPNRPLSSTSFAAVPDLMLTSWSGDGHETASATAHYQASAWFLRYIADRFGMEALSCLLQKSPQGFARSAGFTACGAPGMDLPGLYQQWVVANVVGARSGAGIASYAERGPEAPRTEGLSTDASLDGRVAQFGTDYYELAPGVRSLSFAGAETVPLLAAKSDAAAEFWYAGRFDGAVASLERRLDLSTVDSATLEYDMLFDTESDYDFLYVLASRDEGHTWTLLDAPAMSAANASGNNLGAGYTGRSGGGSAASWIDQAIDLSGFVGGPIHIAFWYVTDDAVNGSGVGLRNVRVASPGLRDDASQPAAGWTTHGWSRVGGTLPQRWSVQVIEMLPDSVRATSLDVDAVGKATWNVRGDARRTIIAVSGLTPVTLERGTYHLSTR